MSFVASHRQQEKMNQALASLLIRFHEDATFGDASRQWRMVVYFYAAVHHVEDQLQRKLYPPSVSHAVRKKNLRNVWGLSQPNVVLAYMDLETGSRDCRYDLRVPTDQELADAEAQLSGVLTHLV